MDVYHFHSARRSITSTSVSLSSDRMVFSMKELTGNIWMAETER